MLDKGFVLNFQETLTEYWQTTMECNVVVFVYTESELACLFIFNAVTWFFPNDVYAIA